MERALVFAEIYSFAGLFASMSNIWKFFLSAVFKFLDISGSRGTDWRESSSGVITPSMP